MKLAAAHALAALAKEDVPDSVLKAYGVDSSSFGRDYLIPKPFDPRVLLWEAPAVARAAMETRRRAQAHRGLRRVPRIARAHHGTVAEGHAHDLPQGQADRRPPHRVPGRRGAVHHPGAPQRGGSGHRAADPAGQQGGDHGAGGAPRHRHRGVRDRRSCHLAALRACSPTELYRLRERKGLTPGRARLSSSTRRCSG